MADGEPRTKTAGADTNGSGTHAETPAVDAPTTGLTRDAAPIAPDPVPGPAAAEDAPAAPTTPARPTAGATLAALAASAASALAALAASVASAAPHAAALAKKWLARLIEFRPSPLLTLAILGGVAALSIVGGLAHPNTAIGQACAVVLVPGLSIALGVVAHRWYSKQGHEQPSATTARSADYSTSQLASSIRFVDDRLGAAQDQLQHGHTFGAFVEVVRAKTAAELALGTSDSVASEHAAQALYTDDDDAQTPGPTTTLITTTGEPNEGSVARVEDRYTLIINRGSAHGVQPDMVFAVMAERGDTIIDPENGEVIGELPIEKLRVKVFDVQPKYSWASTFRTCSKVEHSHQIPGFKNFQPGTETATPARQQISHADVVRATDLPEVPVNIGDKVRRVAPQR